MEPNSSTLLSTYTFLRIKIMNGILNKEISRALYT